MEGHYGRREKLQLEHKDEEHRWGSWWPARNYACSFCKREFRSAQALGGHMNVHRRDRARLRSGIPLWLNPDYQSPKSKYSNPNPNPNPNPSHHQLLINNYSSDHHHLLLHPNSSPSTFPSTSGDDHNKPMLITSSSSSSLPLFTPQSRSEKIKINYEEDLKGSCTCAKEEEVRGFNNIINNKEDDIIINNIPLELELELELGLGLLQHPKEQIDLELRLGHF